MSGVSGLWVIQDALHCFCCDSPYRNYDKETYKRHLTINGALYKVPCWFGEGKALKLES